ncbi:pyruvate kinase, partial [Actinomyces israelii]|uniref:pyruvate kinase n=1 Tax=Actinomyces israelii TaxID=1659 RepID=UPI0023566B3E
MIQNPRPTRAEASDCANAILDGADAVMLSGETSVGAYPIEAVRTMASIIENVEENGGDRIPGLGSYPQTRGGALTRAAAEMGEQLDVTHLVTFTQSGDTARRLSRLRSPLPLLAFTPLRSTRNQLAVSWGVQCYEVPEVEHTDEMVAQVDDLLQRRHFAQAGDTVIIVAGMPPGTPGSTNSIRVHTVGEFD